jgi:P27 family predicted phage terminase small subunit
MTVKTGTRPKPKAARALEGKPRSHHKKKDELEVSKDEFADVKAPSTLSVEAADLWNELAPLLQREKLLSQRDTETFMHLCETGAIARGALLNLKNSKNTLNIIEIDERGKERKPTSLTVFMDSVKLYRSLAAEFGLSPSARVGLEKTNGMDPEDEAGMFFD